jgi:hypothetical protein
MTPHIESAVIAGIVALVVGILASSASVWIYHNQSRTETNAVATAKKLLKQKQYQWRPFELLKRRLGGFDDNELRKILLRAGAVRFYQNWPDIYEADQMESHLVVPDKSKPVELWGPVKSKSIIPFLAKKLSVDEPEYDVPGFLREQRKQKNIHADADEVSIQ